MLKTFICTLVLFSVFLHGDQKICLNMIVKNESKIIERCLESAKGVVDYISISDTGSTDNTVEIIENFMKKNGIPGQVHRHPWKNFGHNRTLSVQASQGMLAHMHVPLADTYLLLLDADMMLVVDPTFSKEELKSDSYLMIQKSNSLTYYNIRLIKASLPWECLGVTHEYWACKERKSESKLTTLSIDDRDDGGSKSDKFERDVRLLTEGLTHEPNNERYMFYMAQSHLCLNNYKEAIKWYQERIARGGWKEEVWYSKFMIGECYEKMGDWSNALTWYMEAFQYNPTRSESLLRIAKYYRLKGENHLAYLFAKRGSEIPFPKEALLFVSHPVYDYQFDEELSIVAYYTPFKKDGEEALNRLILNKNVPHDIKNTAYRNLVHYVQNLKGAHFTPISIELPLIREGMTEKYNPSNPSIQKTADGYQVICRTVNYAQKGAVEFKSRDPSDPTIRTRNFLVDYDKDFNLIAQHEITEELPRVRAEAQVKGLEDCRLIKIDNENWFTASLFDVVPGKIVQTLCKLENSEVKKLIPLHSPKGSRCEKNWLPFLKGDDLFAIYSSDPLIVYQIDRETGELLEVVNHSNSKDYSHFRGSAGPIPFDDGYLMLVHEVAFTDQRFYMHRFVYLDKDFNIQKVSTPFTFLHKGIEYCCGMTLDHSGTKVIMSLGFEDKRAYLCDTPVENVRNLLF